MFVQIGLGVLILASFAACYFASQAWHWGHVLLVEMLFLSSLLFTVLALQNIKLHADFRKRDNDFTKRIEQLEPLTAALKHGTNDPSIISRLEADEVPIPPQAEDQSPGMPGISDLEHQLSLLTRQRGRAWRDVGPATVQGDKIQVQVPNPNPHGIEVDAIVYVFEQGEPALPDPRKGPQYLGEFRVTEVGAGQVTLAIVGTVEDFDRQRIAASKSPWMIYETMPVDEHPTGLLGIFQGATADDLKKLVPAPVLDEYVRHGQPAEQDDDEWHRVGIDADGNPVSVEDLRDNPGKAVKFVYRRRLRDYAFEFQDLTRRWIELQADTAAATETNKKLAATLASAQQLFSFRTTENEALKFDLAGTQRDRSAIEAHLAAVEKLLANGKALLAKTIAENASLVAMLANRQNVLGPVTVTAPLPVPPAAPPASALR